MKNKYAVVIAGPTAVGKTEMAIRVANALGTEIISADSRQVYRELSIGTGIPGHGELKTVRHHLLQHRSVLEPYDASRYENEALEAIGKIFLKHDTAVICGGSGLYIRALCEGIDDIPPADPGIRAGLRERLSSEGLESLRFELSRLDPVSYRSLDLKNPKRILKALEVTMTTGKPYSSYLTRESKPRNFRVVKIALNLERDELYGRINERVDRMMERGLLEEVRALMPLRDRNALNTVGYRELFDHLDSKTRLDEAISLIKRNTRRYARRQITWFKKDPGYHWFESSQQAGIICYIDDKIKASG